jgi:chemotaxis protein CheC
VAGSELTLDELVELEQEALAETGNVILNSCLATMANMLQRNLVMTIPEVLRGNGALLFEVAEGAHYDGLVLFLYIDFALRERDIRGYIAMLMDLPALEALKALLGEFIERVVGES